MTSPSPGIVSPSRDDDEVAGAQLAAADVLERARRRRARWAIVTERVLRSVAAWARPRASATASA